MKYKCIDLINKLKQKGLQFAVAESLTGGAISVSIVTFPGVSTIYKGAVVAYDNRIKTDVLGVKETTLKKYGAVSEGVAREMVLGVKKKFNADVAISTTGIAGPDGGTDEKPVGLVYAGFYICGKTSVVKMLFKGSRKQIISQTVLNVINNAFILLDEMK